MECKGRGTMKCCVSPWGQRSPPLPPPPSPPPLPLGWYIPDQFAEEEPPSITADMWNSQGRGGGGSSRSSPHIKMTKHRTPPPQKKPSKKLQRWSQMRGRRRAREVDGGGNESQGCRAGPRWMVRRALSRISFGHTVNHSAYFFPELCAVQGETTKLQLWCFFLLWSKVSMFSDVFSQFYDSSAPWDLLK